MENTRMIDYSPVDKNFNQIGLYCAALPFYSSCNGASIKLGNMKQLFGPNHLDSYPLTETKHQTFFSVLIIDNNIIVNINFSFKLNPVKVRDNSRLFHFSCVKMCKMNDAKSKPSSF